MVVACIIKSIVTHTDGSCVVLFPDVDLWTDTVVVLAMRLLLMKILLFNTLMTIYVVIKWYDCDQYRTNHTQ